MSKKLIPCLVLLILGMWVISCVTPFYGTARIEPGVHLIFGVAGGSFPALTRWPYRGYMGGVRTDIELFLASNNYFQLNTGIGMGLVKYYDRNARGVLMDVRFGMQTAIPLGVITPALRFDLIPLAFTPILGIGRNEWLTLGGRFYRRQEFYTDEPEIPIVTFLVIHPQKRWSIFAGTLLIARSEDRPPDFTLGVGYKIK